MPFNEFHFSEEWTVPGFSPADIWSGISVADPKALPRWWHGVFQEVTLGGQTEGLDVGTVAHVTAGGFLPYRLRFTLEVTALEPIATIEVRSRGDLDGVWQAKLTEHADGSHIAIEWRVTVNKLIVRLLAPFLKPLLAGNHLWTTPRGEAGLRAYMRHYAAAAAQPLSTS